MNRLLSIKDLSIYRTRLMGCAMLNIMILHAFYVINPDVSQLTRTIVEHIVRLCFVPTFVLLSGLGLAFSFHHTPSLRLYFLKRIKRVLIPFIIISFPFLLYEDIYVHSDVLDFFLDITTLRFWIEGNHLGMWFISTILFLYIIFPVLYKIIFDGNSKGYLIALTACILLDIIISLLFPIWYKSVKLAFNLIPIFVIGVFLAKKTIQKEELKIDFFILFIMLFILNRVLKNYGDFNYWYPILGIIIYIQIYKLFNTKIWKFVEFTGQYTLELYLLHMFLICITQPNFLPKYTYIVFGYYIISFALCKPIHQCIKT